MKSKPLRYNNAAIYLKSEGVRPGAATISTGWPGSLMVWVSGGDDSEDIEEMEKQKGDL